MALCLCKLCINARLYFRPLMTQAAKDGDYFCNLITEFFLSEVNCPMTENGYFAWKCTMGKCDNCKNIKPPMLKCATSNETITVYQFETTNTPYQKSIRKLEKCLKPIRKKQRRYSIRYPYEDLYRNFLKLEKQYLPINTKFIMTNIIGNIF